MRWSCDRRQNIGLRRFRPSDRNSNVAIGRIGHPAIVGCRPREISLRGGNLMQWLPLARGQQLSQVRWKFAPSYPRMVVVRVPGQIDVIEGLQANISVVMSGAVSYHLAFPFLHLPRLTARSSNGNAATTVERHGSSLAVRTRTKRIRLRYHFPFRGASGVLSWIHCHRFRRTGSPSRPSRPAPGARPGR